MVLDIVEALQHPARYEEFMILSADADFSPVLRKVRRHDRRTTDPCGRARCRDLESIRRPA